MNRWAIIECPSGTFIHPEGMIENSPEIYCWVIRPMNRWAIIECPSGTFIHPEGMIENSPEIYFWVIRQNPAKKSFRPDRDD
jgi:hypothetical protein